MKIRSGFVSNSSSSSFIVRREREVLSEELAITKEQDALLEDRGFRKVLTRCPDDIPQSYDEEAWKEIEASIRRHCIPHSEEWTTEKVRHEQYCKDHDVPHYEQKPLIWNWSYQVDCNQDEVTAFLVKHKIPFVASVHYGHYTWIYTPELDQILIGTNVGRIMEMYGGLETYDTKNVLRTIKASEWVEEELKFWSKIAEEEQYEN